MNFLKTVTVFVMLFSLLVVISACSSNTQVDPIVPDPAIEDPVSPDPPQDDSDIVDPLRETPSNPDPPDEEPDDDNLRIEPPNPAGVLVERGHITFTLQPDNSVSIETEDFEYDIDLIWDDGLVITNNGSHIYDFILYSMPVIEGEEVCSARVILSGMTTPPIDIPLEKGTNEFAIYIRDDPTISWPQDPDIIMELRKPGRCSEFKTTPCGEFRYCADMIGIRFEDDISYSELIGVINEYKLIVVNYNQGKKRDGTVLYGHLGTFGIITDGRCPFDVVEALSQEKSVKSAYVFNVVPVDAGEYQTPLC